MKRLTVTHTASHVYDQKAVDAIWWSDLAAAIPDYLRRGDEETNPESRAMTVYEALGDSLLELFHPMQDDDTGYEVEDYDPEA